MSSDLKSLRHRILYVDRKSDKADDFSRERIFNDLSKSYDVDAVIHLTAAVVDIVKRAESGRPFDVIVTHVPPGGCSYSESLAIIADIVRSTDAPVIAFTSAVREDLLLIGLYADIVVQKTNVRQDLVLLRDAIDRSINRRRLSRSVEPPHLNYSDGCVLLEATIVVRGGLKPFVAMAIIKECANFDGEVTFRNLSEDQDWAYDGKSILSLLLLKAVEGTRVAISVAGTGHASATLARRLYGLITSRSAFELRPDYFVIP